MWVCIYGSASLLCGQVAIVVLHLSSNDGLSCSAWSLLCALQLEMEFLMRMCTQYMIGKALSPNDQTQLVCENIQEGSADKFRTGVFESHKSKPVTSCMMLRWACLNSATLKLKSQLNGGAICCWEMHTAVTTYMQGLAAQYLAVSHTCKVTFQDLMQCIGWWLFFCHSTLLCKRICVLKHWKQRLWVSTNCTKPSEPLYIWTAQTSGTATTWWLFTTSMVAYYNIMICAPADKTLFGLMGVNLQLEAYSMVL